MLRQAMLALVAALAAAQGSAAATITFVVPLTGAAEIPGPGDPDGSGTATLMIDSVTNTVSWSITVSDLDPVVAAHIHIGNVFQAGSPVVDFAGQLTGSGLVDADLAAVLATPTGFYVNVHTTAFTGGAIRGQLGQPVPEPVSLALIAAAFSSLGIARRRRA
jgi:hypothetical protein